MKFKLLDGSGEADLSYLIEDTDRHGRVRIYFRKRGRKKIALKSPLGSKEFMAEYQRAFVGIIPTTAPVTQKLVRKAAAPGSLCWLVERYFESDAFTTAGARTQYVRRRILDDICAEPLIEGEDLTPIGSMPITEMTPVQVRVLRDRKKDAPEAGNARVKALRQVFASGVKEDHAKNNPAIGVSYIKTGSLGWHTWTPAEVRQYEERHPIGSKPFLALALLLFLGVRGSDVVRLGPQLVREARDMSEEMRAIFPGRWLQYTQQKNRAKKPVTLTIPILAPLEEVLRITKTGQLAWLVTAFGKPHTANGFGTWFGRRCDEAGIPHCSAHGLRKAGATMAAERGATAHQLMAIFGWRTLKQAEVYTRAAEQMRLAGSGMKLLSRS